MILLLSSYLILDTINPDLVSLNNPNVPLINLPRFGGEEGEDCKVNRDCQAEFTCIRNTCAEPGSEGDSCEDNLDSGCQEEEGLICNMAYGDDGECYLPGGSYRLCKEDEDCKDTYKCAGLINKECIPK